MADRVAQASPLQLDDVLALLVHPFPALFEEVAACLRTPDRGADLLRQAHLDHRVGRTCVFAGAVPERGTPAMYSHAFGEAGGLEDRDPGAVGKSLASPQETVK